MTQTFTSTITTQITLTSPVTIAAGVKVDNSQSALYPSVIDGPGFGTLVDNGYITGSFFAVSLANGGSVSVGTGATIEAFDAVIMAGSAVSTLVNNGLIEGTAIGVSLASAIVTNAATAKIAGGIQLTRGTVTNYGTETGGIVFSAGGTVTNAGTSANISASDAVGVDISGGVGVVSNQGTISSIYLTAGGTVTNNKLVKGVTTAYGINTAGANASYVENIATVSGVGMETGGRLVNAAGGQIVGYNDGVLFNGAGTISNSGTILGVGGLLGEHEPGFGGTLGISFAGSGEILNATTSTVIKGTDTGIALGGSLGHVTVINHGSIIGATSNGYGVIDHGSGTNTIINYGLITGKDALSFGSGDDLLIIEGGSTLHGIVAGGSGTSEVEFAAGTGAVTLAGLNSEFISISSFVNASSSLSLSGSNTLAPSAVFDNLGVVLNPGTLNVFGTLDNTGTFSGAMTVGGLYLPVLAPDPSSAELINGAGGVISTTLATAVAANPYSGLLTVTIENAGTIDDAASGGTAITLNAGLDNLLVLDPSSVITGAINGGATAGSTIGSTLELAAGAGAGTVAQISDFLDVSVDSGATWHIEDSSIADLVNNGVVVLNNTDTIGGAVIQLQPGSDLVLDSSLPGNAMVAFSGTTQALEVADFFAAAATASANDTIDLATVAFNPAGAVSLVSGDKLLVIENGGTNTINLSPSQSLSGMYFHLSSDGFDGTDVVESSVPCFLSGTRIQTPDGERPVERLEIGDLVVTAAGAQRPVKWIGRRHYAAPFPEQADLIPVVIEAGALADGVPARDLYVSPLHGLLIDGFIVPAGALINGHSIRKCSDLAEIDYFHIETEEHDIILANGAPAETFIDETSRNMFDNAETFYALYPQGARGTMALCAPRLEYGGELDRLRRKIALRAGILLDHDAGAEVVGYLEHADRHGISGWAYAPARPNVPVYLDIFNRGALLARTIANIPRPDVKNAGFGTGRYGFSVALPAPLPALQRHEISVRPARAAAMLTGSPIVLDPGVSSELLRTGGLQSLIDAAVRGAPSAAQVQLIGSTLEHAGRQIQVTAARAPVAAKPSLPVAGRLALVLDEFWPNPERDAGSNAVVSHIAALQALGYSVVFCATAGAPADEPARAGCVALQERGVVCHGQDGASAEQVIRNLAGAGLKVAYLHRLGVASAYAGLVKHLAPRARVIYAVADVHALRLERQAAVTGRPELRLRAQAVRAAELWAMQVVDCVVTHSQFEAEYLKNLMPGINVKTVPWEVRPSEPAALKGRADIAFIGGAGHAPNFDAVSYLSGRIMPLVWRVAPEIRCLVVGPDWPAPLFARLDDRIVNAGHLPSLKPLLDQVKLTVAPLRFGAGLKGKVLASLAAGTPCVMSGIAAEGLSLDAALSGAVAEGDGLAEAIVQVYRNKMTQRVLSAAGIDLIRTQFSSDAVISALADALGERNDAGTAAPVKARASAPRQTAAV